MRGTAASPWSRRPSWTPRARSSGWRGCEQAAGADRPRPADRDRPRAVRGLRRLRQGGAGRVRIGRRVGRPLPRPGGGRARAAAARVRCLPRGRDRGVGRDRPPDRPRESQPKPPVVTGLRLGIPRDPCPRRRPGGTALTFWPRSPDRLAFVSSAVVVPFLFTARLFDDNLQHGQINALLLFLCLFAFVLFREQRLIAGGLALALAASLKAVPVLLLGYLAYKRRWRELGWTVAFLVLLNLVIPIALFGPGEVAAQWRAWRAVAAAEMVQPVAHHPNQALLSALKRLLTVEGGARNPIDYALAAWPTTAVVRLFWLVAGFAGLALAFAFRGSSRDLRDPRCAGEFAVCLGAMTLVSPLAWAAHFVTLVAPAAVAWAALRRLPPGAPGRRWRWGLWWASFGCLTLSASGFVGWAWSRRLESFSVITLGAVLLVALAVSVLPTLKRSHDSA